MGPARKVSKQKILGLVSRREQGRWPNENGNMCATCGWGRLLSTHDSLSRCSAYRYWSFSNDHSRIIVKGIAFLRTRSVAEEDRGVGARGGVGAPAVLATALAATRPLIVRSMNVNRTIQIHKLSYCPHKLTLTGQVFGNLHSRRARVRLCERAVICLSVLLRNAVWMWLRSAIGAYSRRLRLHKARNAREIGMRRACNLLVSSSRHDIG